MHNKPALWISGAILGAALAASAGVTQWLAPHRSSLANGSVDWTRGVIEVQGFGKASAESGGYAAARTVAERYAMRDALAVVFQVPVDSTARVGDRDTWKVRMTGWVRGGQVVREKQEKGGLRIWMEFPVSGVKGLLNEVVRASGPAPAPPRPSRIRYEETLPVPAEPVPAEVAVYVDARGVALTEALLPRVLGPAGEVIHDPRAVLNAAAPSPVLYVETSETAPLADLLELPETGVDVAGLPAVALLALYEHQTAAAKDEQKAPATAPKPADDSKGKRARGGPKGYAVKGGGAAGKIPADIILDAASAERAKNDPAIQKALAQGRVVVVVNASVGGVRSRYLKPAR